MQLPLGSPEALKAALEILRDLCDHSPESVLIKAQLIEGYIRAGLEREAESMLQSVPAEDKRVQLEILRAWSFHHRNGNSEGKEHWKVIFLSFGLIQTSNDFVLR
jgi:thioredoxin-like negative regulator of GroEL